MQWSVRNGFRGRGGGVVEIGAGDGQVAGMHLKSPPAPLPGAPDVTQDVPETARRARRRWPLLMVLIGVLAAAGYWLRHVATTPVPPPAAAQPGVRAVPVVAVPARRGDIPVYLNGLGTVTAFNTVTVRSRVDGEIIRIAFREGQHVNEGDLLAEIDPRPFEVQLAQAEGQLARDQAQLKAAKANLERYRDLAARDFIARQQVDDQQAQVGQYEGALKADQAAIDQAKLQLTYSRITAPISGRAGLRLVDVGNIIHAGDQQGIVVITQVQPIAVLFTIPEDDLRPVLARLRAGDTLTVDAYDRAGRTRLATGSLLTTDNQIDQSTGTTRLKAVFPNADHELFPNQFVNARLLLDTRHDAVLVPEAAIQRGPQGTFVYAVAADGTAEVRPVTVGPRAEGDAAVERGLEPGELVVTDGVDKLRAGSRVEVSAPSPAPAAGAAADARAGG